MWSDDIYIHPETRLFSLLKKLIMAPEIAVNMFAMKMFVNCPLNVQLSE